MLKKQKTQCLIGVIDNMATHFLGLHFIFCQVHRRPLFELTQPLRLWILWSIYNGAVNVNLMDRTVQARRGMVCVVGLPWRSIILWFMSAC